MVAKPLCPLYKNIIKPLDRARYPELRYYMFKSMRRFEFRGFSMAKSKFISLRLSNFRNKVAVFSFILLS